MLSLLLCCCCFVVVVWFCLVVVVGLDSAGPPSAGPPKISLFFFPLPPPFRSLCVSLGVFSLNFGGFCEDRDPQMCTFGLSGCGVKPRRLRGRQGFTQQPENSKRTHLRPRRFKTPPKFHEKTPRETQKEPTPFGAPPFGAGLAKVGQLRLAKLAKVGLAKVGQIKVAKVGQ